MSEPDDPENTRFWVLLAPLLAALGLHLYFSFTARQPTGHDAFLHTMWLEEFARQVLDGEWSPRWLYGSYGGFGSPTFYFYPPLTYYIGAAGAFLGAPLSGDILYGIVQTVGLGLSLLTSAILLRSLGARPRQVALGSLLYAITPYHFVDVFVRCALGEHVALGWLPLVFLAAHKLSRAQDLRRSLGNGGLLGLSWALLLLTNLPTAIMAGVVLVPFLFFLAKGRRVQVLSIASLAVLLGSIACATYLATAIQYYDLIRTSKFWQINPVTTDWHHAVIDVFAAFHHHEQLYLATLFTLALSIVLVILWARNQTTRSSDARAWVSVLIVGIVLQLPYVSDWIYDAIRPLQFVQFSWRFAAILILAIAVLLTRYLDRYAFVLTLLIGVTSTIFYVRHLTLEMHVDWPAYAKRDAPEYATIYAPPTDSALMDFVRNHAADPIKQIEHGSVTQSQFEKGRFTANVRAEDSAIVTFHQFYWPTWSVEWSHDRTRISLPPRPSAQGLLEVTTPPGDGIITAQIKKSESAALGNWLSLIATSLLVGLSLCKIRKVSSAS